VSGKSAGLMCSLTWRGSSESRSVTYLVRPSCWRAKRALIIGDLMQLAPVISLKPAQEAEIRREVGVSASRLEKHRLTYHRHSAFHAFETSARGSLLLDEHFRCHPTIAAVSNEQF
jgi:superfamily I DNA and/or RNA helicase